VGFGDSTATSDRAGSGAGAGAGGATGGGETGPGVTRARSSLLDGGSADRAAGAVSTFGCVSRARWLLGCSAAGTRRASGLGGEIRGCGEGGTSRAVMVFGGRGSSFGLAGSTGATDCAFAAGGGGAGAVAIGEGGVAPRIAVLGVGMVGFVTAAVGVLASGGVDGATTRGAGDCSAGEVAFTDAVPMIAGLRRAV